jgi:hypothetical protein
VITIATKKEINERLNEQVLDYCEKADLRLMGSFTKAIDIHTFQCTKCEDIFTYQASRLLSHQKTCSLCKRDEKIEQIRQEKLALFQQFCASKQFTIVGDFIHLEKKIEVSCQNGHTWFGKPKTMIDNQSVCQKCHKKSVHSTKQRFEKLCKEKKWEIQSDYTYATNEVTLKCENNHIWSGKPKNMLFGGNGCVQCKRKQLEDHLVEQAISRGYVIITELSEIKDRMIVKCKNQHLWDVSAANFKRGSDCPKCPSLQQKRGEQLFLDKAKETNYIPLEPYQKNNEKVKIMCPVGHIWRITPSDFKQGYGCPHCQNSKGAIKIKDYLMEHHISFIPEWRDHQCIYKRTMPYDFYLPELNVAIEYQGRQHTEFVDVFHRDLDGFNEQLKKDTLKKQYCLDNGIHFLEISYLDFDKVEGILSHAIHELTTRK